jgi:osmoprotectant transport system permease protein
MTLYNYLLSAWPEILHLTMQHLMLVGIAVGLAILIGVPLGIVMVRYRWLAGPMMGGATVILTLPSIALFGLMIPLFSRFGEGLRRLPRSSCTRCYRSCVIPISRWTVSRVVSRKLASASA